MLAAVEALAVDEFVIIFGELERLGHLLVGQGPVAVGVVEVVGAVLEEGADRLRGGLADQGLVVMAPFAGGLAAGDVGEATDPGRDLAIRNTLDPPYPRFPAPDFGVNRYRSTLWAAGLYAALTIA